MTDPNPDELPEPQRPPDSEPETEAAASSRFAVYDKDLLRFVGPVTDKRPSAKAVKDLVGDHASEVREV